MWNYRSLSTWMEYAKRILPSICPCMCVNSYKFLRRKTIIHIHSLLKQLVQFQFMASVIFFHTFMGLCFQVQRHEDTFRMFVTVVAVRVWLFLMWLSFKDTYIQYKLVGRCFFLLTVYEQFDYIKVILHWHFSFLRSYQLFRSLKSLNVSFRRNQVNYFRIINSVCVMLLLNKKNWSVWIHRIHWIR